MLSIALKLLVGDKVKYVGLVFGVAFSTVLITQQAGIFFGVIKRTSAVIRDVAEADIWVMDPSVVYVDASRTMRNAELDRVRGVAGVYWATRFYKANVPMRTSSGTVETAMLLGADDQSLVGAPRRFLIGNRDSLRLPESVALDRAGFLRLFPGRELAIGDRLEINDRRAVVTAIVEANAPFATAPVIYTRYSEAVAYFPQGRDQMNFILAKAAPGLNVADVVKRIQKETGLRADTADAFRQMTEDYYMENTAIPVNFGVVISLGAAIGVAVVGLTLHMFISDNIKHYAVLRAIGVTYRQIRKMVLCQAALVGLLGYALGIFGAACFFKIAERNLLEFRGLYLPWWLTLVSLLLTTLIIIVCVYSSLRSLAKVDPAMAIRGQT